MTEIIVLSKTEFTDIIKNVVIETINNLSKVELAPLNSSQNELMDMDDIVKYLRLTKPTIYSKISKREIPHFKQSNRIYFDRVEIDNWIKSKKRLTHTEIIQEAQNYIRNKSSRR